MGRAQSLAKALGVVLGLSAVAVVGASKEALGQAFERLGARRDQAHVSSCGEYTTCGSCVVGRKTRLGLDSA